VHDAVNLERLHSVFSGDSGSMDFYRWYNGKLRLEGNELGLLEWLFLETRVYGWIELYTDT